MTDADFAVWAEHLRKTYGIANPMSDDTEDTDDE